MARISLESALNESFINSFRGLASKSDSAAQQLRSAMQGGSSNSSISSGLRVGARTFADSLKSLNSAVALLNISGAKLEELGNLTDKMLSLSERASQTALGQQSRNNVDREFKKLAGEFREIVDSAQIGDRELLSLDGLQEILESVGLDAQSSSALADLISDFVLSEEDQLLASEEIKGERPVKISPGQKLSEEFSSLFSSEANIRSQPDAVRVSTDLKALSAQIKTNLEKLNETIGFVEENMQLVRATGLAFLELSDQIGSSQDAASVASMLRREIRREAGLAVRQAGNLEPIVVAALARE